MYECHVSKRWYCTIILMWLAASCVFRCAQESSTYPAHCVTCTPTFPLSAMRLADIYIYIYVYVCMYICKYIFQAYLNEHFSVMIIAVCSKSVHVNRLTTEIDWICITGLFTHTFNWFFFKIEAVQIAQDIRRLLKCED